jgi:small subunit ribosomal protein S18
VVKEKSRRPKSSTWSRGRYVPKRKICLFCSNKINEIDYKDPSKLRRYVSDRGKIEPRRKTGTCAKHQRALATSIKRARHLALLPFASAHVHKTESSGMRD